jgi:hypothetical protein
MALRAQNRGSAEQLFHNIKTAMSGVPIEHPAERFHAPVTS